LSYLTADEWAELLIVSALDLLPSEDFLVTSEAIQTHSPDHPAASMLDALPGVKLNADKAPGTKCARCWRVLTEVGQQPNHPSLCARCADAVESGLVCRA
jgi:isoleucyl-tRNA synthetase